MMVSGHYPKAQTDFSLWDPLTPKSIASASLLDTPGRVSWGLLYESAPSCQPLTEVGGSNQPRRT